MRKMPESGGLYRFRVNNSSGNALNLYYTGSTKNGTKINVMSTDGSREQLWQFDGDRLFTEHARDRQCLDCDKYSYKADIWENDSREDDYQLIDFIPVSSSDGYLGKKCKIKLRNLNKYLVASTSQCTWGTSANATVWTVERISRVTDMPKGQYPGNVEYFHEDAMSDGTFLDNVGVNYLNALSVFYERVFGRTPTDGEILYNLHGALMNSGPDIGKFHNGIDMQGPTGAEMRSGHTGTVDNSLSYALGIGHDGEDKCWYLHMAKKKSLTYATCNPKNRNESTLIGYKGSVGASSEHFHFEYGPQPQPPIIDANTRMKSQDPYMALVYHDITE